MTPEQYEWFLLAVALMVLSGAVLGLLMIIARLLFPGLFQRRHDDD